MNTLKTERLLAILAIITFPTALIVSGAGQQTPSPTEGDPHAV